MEDYNDGVKSKVCWFPFKKVYDKRRIKPEFDEPANKFYLKKNILSKPIEVTLYEYGGGSGEEAGETELVLQGHPMPTELLPVPRAMKYYDDNSIAQEEEPLHVYVPNNNMQLADINPNCLSKEFWVDEVAEGGSLACGADSFMQAQRFTGNARQRSAYTRASTYASTEGDSTATFPGDETASQDSSAIPHSRIEVEYVPPNQPIPRRAMQKVKPTTDPGLCGVKRKSSRDAPTRGDLSSISHDFSTLGSDTHATASVDPPGNRKMMNFVNLATYNVEPDQLDPPFKRVLCGNIPAIRSCNGMQLEPDSSVMASSAKKSLAAWSARQAAEPVARRVPPRTPSPEPQFFVEVEATQKQLSEIRDLEQLTYHPPSHDTDVVELARTASLVDEDSAFMDAAQASNAMRIDHTGSFRRTTSRREEPVHNSPVRQRSLHVPPTQRMPQPITPERQESRQSGSQSTNRSGDQGVSMALHRSRTSESRGGPFHRNHHSEIRENPSHTAIHPSRTSSRVNNAPAYPMQTSQSRRSERPNQQHAEDPYHQAPPSPDRRQTSRSRSQVNKVSPEATRRPVDSPERRHRERSNAGHGSPQRRKNHSHGEYEDFELARFPSLNTEDWKQSASQNVPVNRATSSSLRRDHELQWARSNFSNDYDAHLDPEVKPQNIWKERFEGDSQSSAPDQWQRDHEFSRTPSLDESFDNAVPHGPEYTRDQMYNNGRNADMSRFSKGESDSGFVIRSPRTMEGNGNGIRAGNPNKFYDDDDSELNTEAFRKLALENDDDSIFNDLDPGQQSSRMLTVEDTTTQSEYDEAQAHLEEQSRGSIVSETSRDQTRYTTQTMDVSKSREDLYSVYSKISMVSRGDTTAFSQSHSVVNEPFACMDTWLN